MIRDFFIEIESVHHQKSKKQTCGDVFLSKKIQSEDRMVAVLSDGLGSGIKANILATMTASMALNFTIANEPLERTAGVIMNTLPVDKVRKISYATFSIVDIEYNNIIKILEYGNPSAILIRDGKLVVLNKDSLKIAHSKQIRHKIFKSAFTAQKEDRLILFTDGVSQSGMGKDSMPFGWDIEQIIQMILSEIKKVPNISAASLAKKIVARALKNDDFQAQDDISCAVIYFRNPRKMLLCSGPPFNLENDNYLAKLVTEYDGVKVISGGTTAQILSRELKLDIEVDIYVKTMGLPPSSKIKGFDLVTEGVLTMGRVTKILEDYTSKDTLEESPAGDIVQFFLDNDRVDFVVGTRVNNAHQDPSLPVELEIRRNVIKKVARLLEDKFLKEIHIKYI